jgi:hypothetical protein
VEIFVMSAAKLTAALVKVLNEVPHDNYQH